ncbi:MAG: antitoxin MazE family protein, partial [Pusillimonas sp.]|nr:antitoxin MazE family protein [Pusillimonas sp.]
MATAHVNQRVQKHRDARRRAGLRPVQIWVPDTRRPDFAQECRRQCLLAAQADSADTAMQGDFGKSRPALVIQANHFSEHSSASVL